MTDEANALFHRLWSKAVGQPDYDKAEWLRLEELLIGSRPAELSPNNDAIAYIAVPVEEVDLLDTGKTFAVDADGKACELKPYKTGAPSGRTGESYEAWRGGMITQMEAAQKQAFRRHENITGADE